MKESGWQTRLITKTSSFWWETLRITLPCSNQNTKMTLTRLQWPTWCAGVVESTYSSIISRSCRALWINAGMGTAPIWTSSLSRNKRSKSSEMKAKTVSKSAGSSTLPCLASRDARSSSRLRYSTERSWRSTLFPWKTLPLLLRMPR